MRRMKVYLILIIVAFSFTGCVEMLAYSTAASFGSSLGMTSGAKIGSKVGDKIANTLD